jgi:hypothetical protein
MRASLDRRTCFLLLVSTFSFSRPTEGSTLSTSRANISPATLKSNTHEPTRPTNSNSTRYDTVEIPRGPHATTITTDGHTYTFSAVPAISDSSVGNSITAVYDVVFEDVITTGRILVSRII